MRAATDVFSRREFHAVPVEDVAIAAGVGKGTLYLYFPTKEQLFYATILEALDVLIAELRAAVRAHDGENALTAFVACMLDFFRRRRPLAMLMHRYEHRLREPEGGEWRARRVQMVEVARALVASCVALEPEAATLATEMLLASVRTAVLNQPDGEDPEHTAAAQPAIAVAVAPVTSATVERTTDLVGSFFANEEVTVASQIEARVVWLGADMGDHVAQGDAIVRFDDADLQAQLREVEARLV